MFFNQLVKAADPEDLASALNTALPPPADESDARKKIQDFLEFVERTRTRAEATGATKPAPGRVPAFLSFFWELVDRDQWPLFYPSSRDVLEQHGALEASGTFDDLYERYREVIFDLRKRFDTDPWWVEHLLWKLSPLGSDSDELSEDDTSSGGEAEQASAGDVYAGYRAQQLIFPDEVVTSFVLSLATKGFVILSGISGTGKTKIALGLARYLESTGGGQLVEIESPVDDDESFYIKLTSGRYQRMRSTLKQSAREVIPVPERGTSSSFEVELEGGGSGSMRLNNIGFTDESKEAVILFFRKEMAEWVRGNARVGDYLHFHIPTDGSANEVRVLEQVVEESGETIERHLLLPVRADWTDPRGLLGYFNPITGEYVRTELLDLILRAIADPDHPYFVILDEMNLAHVEYYFSVSLVRSKAKSRYRCSRAPWMRTQSTRTSPRRSSSRRT